MPSKPRVLHVYKDFDPFRGGGGVARHIHGLASALASAGYRVRVLAPQAVPLENPFTTGHWSIGGLVREVRAADVVHVHGARTVVSAITAAVGWALGRKIVYTPHCYYDTDVAQWKRFAKRAWDRLVEKPLLARSACTVLLNESWREYLSGRRLPAANTAIIPNCVLDSGLPRSATSDRLSGAPAILTVGRLDPVKRVDDVIRALGEPALASAELHIVGRGPAQPRLERLVAELGLGARVHFHGFQTDEAVAAMAAGAQVFALASEAEGMPTVLIEMLLRGLPVVASDIPGNRSVLDPLGVADIYRLGDVPALAAALATAGGSPVSPAIRAAATRAFTWEGQVDRVAAIYEEGRSA